jgi:hypothetical protein
MVRSVAQQVPLSARQVVQKGLPHHQAKIVKQKTIILCCSKTILKSAAAAAYLQLCKDLFHLRHCPCAVHKLANLHTHGVVCSKAQKAQALKERAAAAAAVGCRCRAVQGSRTHLWVCKLVTGDQRQESDGLARAGGHLGRGSSMRQHTIC